MKHDVVMDFLPYRDQYGFTSSYPDGRSTQNGALFTMEYLFCLLNSDAPSDTKLTAMARIRELFAKLEVIPGLARRSPDSMEGDSMDNECALLVFSAMFGDMEFAKRMYIHGRDTPCLGIDAHQDPERNKKFYKLAWVLSGFKPPRWVWNNTRPGEFAFWGWWGRSPGFVALAALAAGYKLSWFQSFALWVGQFLGLLSKTTNTDARKLPYIVWQLLKTQNKFWSLSYRLWLYILHKQYPNGMKDVYALYFGANSPFAKHGEA